MGNCKGCGKKLRWSEGYETSDGEFCKECYSKKEEIMGKREKIESKKHKQEKENDEKKEIKKEKIQQDPNRRCVFAGILIIVVLLVIFNPFNNKLEDYSDCVDDCIYEMEFCPDYEYGGDMSKWISEYEFDGCFSDLEQCISRCELNYKN